MNHCESLWSTTNCYELLWITTKSAWITVNYYGLPRITRNYHELLWITVDCHKKRVNYYELQELVWIWKMFFWFWLGVYWICMGFSGSCEGFCRMYVGLLYYFLDDMNGFSCSRIFHAFFGREGTESRMDFYRYGTILQLFSRGVRRSRPQGPSSSELGPSIWKSKKNLKLRKKCFPPDWPRELPLVKMQRKTWRRG